MKMSKKIILFLAILLFSIILNGERYRLTYWFSGNGSSKVLLFFSFRFYYEAAGSIDFIAEKSQSGLEFNFFCLPEVNYLKRTLNFSGSSLAVVAIPPDGKELDPTFFLRQIEDPYYLSLKSTSNVKKKRAAIYAYHRKDANRKAFYFLRKADGTVTAIENNLIRFVLNEDNKIAITFDPFKMSAVLLQFYFPLFRGELPPDEILLKKNSWKITDLNLSENLSRLAAAIEEVVKKYVQVNQKAPLLIDFKITGPDSALKMKICGQSEREVYFWKDFRIIQLKREIEIDLRGGCIFDINYDKISMQIGDNGNNQGFGFMEIKKIKEY